MSSNTFTTVFLSRRAEYDNIKGRSMTIIYHYMSFQFKNQNIVFFVNERCHKVMNLHSHSFQMIFLVRIVFCLANAGLPTRQ